MKKQSKAKYNVENHTDIVIRLRKNKELDLIKLTLNKRELNCKWGTDIFKALKINRTVTYLYIHDCDINTDQAYILANALELNETITTLILSRIFINSDGEIALSNALLVNKTLIVLKLYMNGLGNGIIPICNSLQLNKTITKLTIASNFMHGVETDSIGISIAFADMLKVNKTITFLDISYNILEDSGAIIISEALEFNNTLKTLDIGDNNFSDEGIIAIANMLKINRTLEKLILDISYFTELGSAALVDALQINNTIMEIISENVPIEEHNEIITSSLLRNKMIYNSFWSAKKHHIFPQKCHTTIMCTLLSAGRFLPALPEEIWRVHILPYLRYSDFT